MQVNMEGEKKLFAKPMPNFGHLHKQWEEKLKSKLRRSPVVLRNPGGKTTASKPRKAYNQANIFNEKKSSTQQGDQRLENTFSLNADEFESVPESLKEIISQPGRETSKKEKRAQKIGRHSSTRLSGPHPSWKRLCKNVAQKMNEHQEKEDASTSTVTADPKEIPRRLDPRQLRNGMQKIQITSDATGPPVSAQFTLGTPRHVPTSNGTQRNMTTPRRVAISSTPGSGPRNIGRPRRVPVSDSKQNIGRSESNTPNKTFYLGQRICEKWNNILGTFVVNEPSMSATVVPQQKLMSTVVHLSHSQNAGSTKPRTVLGELDSGEIAIRSSPTYVESIKNPKKDMAEAIDYGVNKIKAVHFQSPPKRTMSSVAQRYLDNTCEDGSRGSKDVAKLPRITALRKEARFSPIRCSKSSSSNPKSCLKKTPNPRLYSPNKEVNKENISPTYSLITASMTMSHGSVQKLITTCPRRADDFKDEITDDEDETSTTGYKHARKRLSFDDANEKSPSNLDEKGSIPNLQLCTHGKFLANMTTKHCKRMSLAELDKTLDESLAAQSELQLTRSQLEKTQNVLESSELNLDSSVDVRMQLEWVQKELKKLRKCQIKLQERLLNEGDSKESLKTLPSPSKENQGGYNHVDKTMVKGMAKRSDLSKQKKKQELIYPNIVGEKTGNGSQLTGWDYFKFDAEKDTIFGRNEDRERLSDCGDYDDITTKAIVLFTDKAAETASEDTSSESEDLTNNHHINSAVIACNVVDISPIQSSQLLYQPDPTEGPIRTGGAEQTYSSTAFKSRLGSETPGKHWKKAYLQDVQEEVTIKCSPKKLCMSPKKDEIDFLDSVVRIDNSELHSYAVIVNAEGLSGIDSIVEVQNLESFKVLEKDAAQPQVD